MNRKNGAALFFKAWVCLVTAGGASAPVEAAPCTPTPGITDAVSLRDAMINAANNSTVCVPDGIYDTNDLPLRWGTGSFTFSGKSNVTLQSASDDPARVILRGRGFENYYDNDDIVMIYASAGVTIRSLTLEDANDFGIKVEAGLAPVASDIHILNCRFFNINKRAIKGTAPGSNTGVVSGGEIRNCVFENTKIPSLDDNTPPNPDTNGDYVTSIDMMALEDWVIADNTFLNIRGLTGAGRAAIFVWNRSRRLTVERNVIIGCDRGIGMGNNYIGDTSLRHVYDSVVRNNFVAMTRTDAWTDAGIELGWVDNVRVTNNTIWRAELSHVNSSGNLAPLRGVYPNGTNGNTLVVNNIIMGDQIASSGVTYTNNLSAVTNSYFASPFLGDLHLTAAAANALNAGSVQAEVTEDIDRHPRANPPDLGAAEYTPSDPVYTLSVAGGTGDGSYTAGTVVVVTADAPSPGQVFDHWSGTVSTLGNTLTPTSSFRMPASAATLTAVSVDAPILPSHDKARANAYDDAWEAAWVAHCRFVYASAGKTTGFTLHLGDSITHANPYTAWPRFGAGRTTEDMALINWARMENSFYDTSGVMTNSSNKNGFYLAAADTTGNRGMTASSGIDANEYLNGLGNGGATMPSVANPSSARLTISSGTYYGSLHIDTVIAAFSDAQFAVVMLGTNDVSGTRTVNAFIADMGVLLDRLEAARIVPVLSTIPPHIGNQSLAQTYNVAIRTLAQTRSLPLIDFYEEVLARRPGTTWNGTLFGAGDVHPTATNAAGDPYANAGDPALHRTGANCDNGGYLLRSWLTVQKMKEVRAYVVDGQNPPGLPTEPPARPRRLRVR